MIKGVYCATVTPFRNGELDLESFAKLIQFLKGKVNGVLVCGTTGEFPLLSTNEKKGAY